MTDEFEKWYSDRWKEGVPPQQAGIFYSITALQAAYSAGASAMREKCKEVCLADIQDRAITITQAQQETHNNACRYLASAIERVEI